MSAAPPAAPPPAAPAQTGEACPLCGAPLAPEQEWCLRCGAAARTRLAATPGWKGPVAAVAVVAALSLGVIAAALVKLAGDSGPAPAPITRTLTTASTGPATVSTPTAVLPGATATTPAVPSTPTTLVPPATTATGTTSTAAKALAPSNAGGHNTKAGKGLLRGLLGK